MNIFLHGDEIKASFSQHQFLEAVRLYKSGRPFYNSLSAYIAWALFNVYPQITFPDAAILGFEVVEDHGFRDFQRNDGTWTVV
jgi:hypothetical protein